jgi:hypothetical protein
MKAKPLAPPDAKPALYANALVDHGKLRLLIHAYAIHPSPVPWTDLDAGIATTLWPAQLSIDDAYPHHSYLN